MRIVFALLFLFVVSVSQVFASGSELSKLATAYYGDNNKNKTIETILQINEKDRSALDWLLLGNTLADNGETDNAVFMYNKAISVDSKFYKAYYNLANHYAEKGQLNLAIKYYTKAASLKKDNPYILYNLANIYITQKDYSKARTYLNKALVINSNIPEIHYNLVYVYQMMNKQKQADVYLKNYEKLVNN